MLLLVTHVAVAVAVVAVAHIAVVAHVVVVPNVTTPLHIWLSIKTANNNQATTQRWWCFYSYHDQMRSHRIIVGVAVADISTNMTTTQHRQQQQSAVIAIPSKSQAVIAVANIAA